MTNNTSGDTYYCFTIKAFTIHLTEFTFLKSINHIVSVVEICYLLKLEWRIGKWKEKNGWNRNGNEEIMGMGMGMRGSGSNEVNVGNQGRNAGILDEIVSNAGIRIGIREMR